MSRDDDSGDAGPSGSRTDDFRSTDSAEQNDSRGLHLNRRTYLKLASAVVVAGGGALVLSDDGLEMRPQTVFGYGGAPAADDADAPLVSVAGREREPNDDREVATRIETGSAIQGELDSDEVDWFTFEAESGDELTVEFEREEEEGVTAVALYDRAGHFLDQVYVGSNAPTQLAEHVTETGSYFVQLVDVQDGNSEYTLTVSVTPGETQPPTETTQTPTPTATTTTESVETTQTTTAETTQTETATETATEITQTETTTQTTTQTTQPATETTTQTTEAPTATTQTTVAPDSTTTESTTQTTTDADEYGQQRYGEYGYGGVLS
ncbi:hypothetical protein [Haladaptatus sp. DYSN1]|uniref:hypothetical protein n=1 Tax=unclassified Haladaptatus TaxID=2622732 RepID=UPI0024053FA0|nr:hypothetical protein [Haladaptatus sp. DYSN1]